MATTTTATPTDQAPTGKRKPVDDVEMLPSNFEINVLRPMMPRESLFHTAVAAVVVVFFKPEWIAMAAPVVYDAVMSMRAAWTALAARHGLAWIMTVDLFLLTTASYWLHALALGVLDWSLRYPTSALGRFALQHKIQDAKIVPWRDWVKCAKTVLFNQIILNPIVGYLFMQLHASRVPCVSEVECNAWAATIPDAATVARDLVIFIVVEEVLFYWSHRLFHWAPLYKAVHKQHHEFTAPIGLAATYAHPVEHALSNLGPVLLGPVVMGSHPLTTGLWTVVAIATTIHTHSGYELWGMPSARKHDWHHYAFIYQFGVLGLLDAVCGTEGGDRWRRYVRRYDARQEVEKVEGDDKLKAE
ncbi:hypothetical protein AMAG_01268 [Allomyces macrogynus ATCC 38327]|uniref:Fatty acid hydroxylase domain-containing protein n=1 Tax=Allomyces macrogynus (strain ATCC 38327) TaxID=578462 RepID=A0A0L0RYD7_ALLM3|nr:hypothetical protein AMAG_01268 [Allomyces macrogynus ATCC 38327]|eukprot:KNE55368.1 hypothetical protein AMAG_01268 [Allomyces macrogynus ATCC 38327]